MLSESFQTTLTEHIIHVPVNWTSYNLCTTSIMDLNFLDPLRLVNEEDVFFPKKIFIRDCMKEVFQVFCADAQIVGRKAGSFQTVLIGSPGVGKSVLFFLVALYQAQFSYIMYYRRTTIEGLAIAIIYLFCSGLLCPPK